MKPLYPIQFHPIFKERIWGGEKLQTVLQKNSQGSSIGESWEISDVKHDETIVKNGHLKGKTLKEIIQSYKEEFLGKKVYQAFGENFPLLIKYIDAKKDLSIQLHPNDELAKKRHNSFGKTEMWYVMQADDDANLIVGFNKEVDKKTYQKHLENKTLPKILNYEKVAQGDVYFLPTGRIHAIGAGIVLAEIQQTSDITYRVYDWDRQDSQGNYRELHTELAADAIDYTFYDSYKTNYKSIDNEISPVVSCPYFITNLIPLKSNITLDYSGNDSFVIYMCVKGECILATSDFNIKISFGETILIPASITSVTLKTENTAEILEIYIP